ncbi:Metallo-dependent hydrolase [Myriangium duriaei CBS 260.36]|uniref:adenosine deaminase n=1 Tax=Myriangium duriaei CBS 260.36 TaxID=1168546 RepID=A0A9P4MEJ8_9PEZI|nr:Metallo-dependent hydrolase [Myriangium duriaei CBS 260.36]
MTGTAAPSDAEWRRSEGVPSLEEPFLKKYLHGREALIAQEKKHRSDHAFREVLSPMAREASGIVRQIRDEELRTVWTKDSDSGVPVQTTDIFPGMMFYQAKERMEKTKLWNIVKKMPKGALLHCHFEAMVDIDWILDQLFAYGGIHIQASRSLHNEQIRTKSQFQLAWRKSTVNSNTSIWSESYTPDELIPIDVAADTFPAGGRQGFRAWIRSRASITHDESIMHHEGGNEIWRKFISCFDVLRTCLCYEPIWKKSIKHVLGMLADDGVQYVDFRAVFRNAYFREGSETPEPNNFRRIEAMEEAIDEFMDSEKGKNFWGARLIWTDIRILPTNLIIEGMKECIAIKQKHPDLIAGYDLVGQEDTGRPLVDFLPELFWFKKAAAEAGVELPFFFHAGETLGDGDKIDQNLFDAILLGTRRIGHGFSLYKHPLLVDMVKDKKILVESCPISNEVLRLTHSVMSHPLPALLSRGVPVALCNDDPGIFGHEVSGITYDFWQALQGWENLGLEGMGSLAENSVRWASFDDFSTAEWQKELKDGAFGEGERAMRMKEWAHQWEEYCAWIVKEYGQEYGAMQGL